MQTLTIGDIRIDRVLEQEGPIFGLDFLLPEAPADMFDANADWLTPRFADPASRNLILSFHSLLVRTPSRTILVDACVGNDKERPERPPWHRAQFPFLDNLAKHGVAPEDIDIVLCTHLHADHVGWNTRLLDGRWVPTFPNATYVFARREYAHWEAENAKASADEPLLHGSFADSVLPIVDAGRAQLVESDHELDHGIRLEPAPGHTPGNIVIRVERNGARALLVGDAIHSPAQFADPGLSTRFCSDPVQSAETRTRLIDEVAETDTAFLTAHFPTPTLGRVIRRGKAFGFEDL
jgi:glyoxylase-like metal-dependent hydrolase (beta-lactamase superfamily II)